MASPVVRRRRWAGYGAFYVGMSVIVASALLNIAYDRLPGVGAHMMPPFLSHMYATSGKEGVTLVFVALGMSIILLGLAMPKSREEQRASSRSGAGRSAAPLYTAPGDEAANEPTTTAYGTVVLRTRRYVSPNSGLSGATGWGPPRPTS